MTAPERPAAELAALGEYAERDPIAALGVLATWPDTDERQRIATAIVRKVLLPGPDELTRQRLRAAVKRGRLLTMAAFDALAAELGDMGAGGTAPHPCGLPGEACDVPGMPSAAYVPGDPGRGDPGRVWELKRHEWHELLPWAPAVLAHLAAAGDRGEAGMQFYEIAAGGRSGVWSHDELVGGKPWEVLPVPGTASRRMREVLALIVQAEAAQKTLRAALTRTGWHLGEDGKPFYVFADGRAHDGRDVCLASSWGDALGEAAGPVLPVLPAEIPTALRAIADRGGPAALVALGLGVRGLGHSFHAVPGGVVFVGVKFSGKTSAAWHARNLLFVRQHRQGNYPPVPSTVFAASPAALEGVLDFEADSPALVEDLALPEDCSRKDRDVAEAKLELIFRSLFNDTEIKPRSNISLGHRPGRRVRSVVMATAESLPAKSSLLTRVLRFRVEHGTADFEWYKGPDNTKRNSAELVPPLRTLGEHLVIPALATLADAAGEYLAQRDAEGMSLLAPALEAALPGWESSPTGIARVAEIAAAALSGLVIAAVEASMPRLELAAAALPALVRELAAQADELGDMGGADDRAELVGAVLRGAALDGRAHGRDDQGVPYPAIPGLTEQEQGLELIPGSHTAAPQYRGRGVPFYWLPELGALGVPSAGLHKLIAAAKDPRLPAKPVTRLPGWLVAEGIALPSGQQTSPYVRLERIGGEPRRVVLIRSDIFLGNTSGDDAPGPVTPVTPVTPQAGGPESNAAPETDIPQPVTQQVEGTLTNASGADAEDSDSPSDLQGNGCNGLEAAHPVQTAAAPARCAVCDRSLDAKLAALGDTTHPCCDPGPPLSAAEGAAARWSAELAEDAPAAALELGDVDQAHELAEADRAPATASASTRRTSSFKAADRSPGWAFACLDAEGRAHGPDGEVLALPPGRLEAIAALERGGMGELAELGLELTARRYGRGVLHVPPAMRAALGLPPELGELKVGEGLAHPFADVDPARWDVWPAGLSAWPTVYRRPESLHEGVDVAFPEYARPVRGDGPQLGELSAPELAAALTLIWRATCQPGGSAAGSVHYHRSPPATMKRLLEASARRSRLGEVPEARVMPPPFTTEGRKAHSAIRRPVANHVGPPAEVPPGWVLAHLDVRAAFLSAPIGTDFAAGEYEHLTPGRLDKRPGVHLVRVPAEAAVIHPALAPWFPAPKPRQREVWAWLDTLAARWLGDRGVPLEVSMSYAAPPHRVFDGPMRRLGDARAELKAAPGRPAAAAAMIVTAMYQHTLGGWIASENWDRTGDWLHAPDWWLTINTQAEVRKQRALWPSVSSGALLLLANDAIDTVFVAAPSLEALEALTTGGRQSRPLIRDGRGGFRLEAVAEVTPALAAELAAPERARRLAAIKDALEAAGEAESDDRK